MNDFDCGGIPPARKNFVDCLRTKKIAIDIFALCRLEIFKIEFHCSTVSRSLAVFFV